jgi:glycosyltransferase involved in cell wall biosynthesis
MTDAAAGIESLSVFFPAYNEEANIERTVTNAKAALDRVGVATYELIVVDDGSVDRTGAIADELAVSDPRVRVVHHDVNRGYGAALRSGLAASRHPWVFWTDGDGQFDVAEVAKLFAVADDADIVAGYRMHRADHVVRRVNARLWTLVVRVALGLRVRDVDCAFKLLRREWLDRITPIESDGALASAELLVKLACAGARRVEVGVHHYPRVAGEPTGGSPRVIFAALRDLARQRRALREVTTAG